MAKLKVFTTPIGFHDVYVAAPSRAAALRAWGSDRDLFAREMAREVTDPALTRAPLAEPGTVIRRSRGTAAEQFAALSDGETAPANRKRIARQPPPEPQPRPSPHALDEAKAALDAAIKRHRHDDAVAKARVAEAERRRRELQREHDREAKNLQAALDVAQARYDRAVERWRHDAEA
jgi:hypothetical protein